MGAPESVPILKTGSRMEPMELDDNGTGNNPAMGFPPTRSNRRTYPGSSSAPACSPFPTRSASGMLSGFSPAKAPISSTPQPFFRSTRFSKWQGCFASPFPTQRTVSREATPSQAVLGSPRGLGMITSDRASFGSMETSEPSDVSEMEVVQSSPSPSPTWECIRSALSNFSLFKGEPESDQSSAEPGVYQVGGLPGEKEMVKAADINRRSWEPTLSAVQAAVTFKQSKGRNVSKGGGPDGEKEMAKAADTSYRKSWEPTLSAVYAAASFKKSKGRNVSKGGENHGEKEMAKAANTSYRQSWAPTLSAVQAAATFKKSKGRNVYKDGGSHKEMEMAKAGDTSYRKSWEPTLSSVQAAATFKKSKGRKSSPSKLTVTEAQCIESTGSEEKPQDEETETDIFRSSQTAEQAEKSRCCSCGMCISVLSVFVLLGAVVCAVLLQRLVGTQRETFASVDTQLLKNEMASRVFGQHIAGDVVPKSIEQYLRALHARKDRESKDCFIPPLVLSFHGWTGVGKNFVSDTITGVFPVKTVTKLLIPYHFPHQNLDQLYQGQVHGWIVSNVTDYSVNFFILDEMDKATPGVTQGIHNALTKLRQENSCRSPVVFLFLSNSFGTAINQRVFQAMVEKEDRDSLSVSDFSSLFEDSDDTESWYRSLQSDITVTIPFLPLEKQHVVQCIRRDLVSKKLSTHIDLVIRVLKELMFTKLPSGQKFSQTGCKRVSDKVNLVAFD